MINVTKSFRCATRENPNRRRRGEASLSTYTYQFQAFFGGEKQVVCSMGAKHIKLSVKPGGTPSRPSCTDAISYCEPLGRKRKRYYLQIIMLKLHNVEVQRSRGPSSVIVPQNRPISRSNITVAPLYDIDNQQATFPMLCNTSNRWMEARAGRGDNCAMTATVGHDADLLSGICPIVR
jgi:hypothetical protein